MIKINKKLLFLLFLCFSLNSYAQPKYQADKRLYECMPASYISDIEQNNPDLVAYYNYFLDNSYYVVNLKTAEKPVTGIDIKTISVKKELDGDKKFSEKTYSKENFNIMKYEFNFTMNGFTTYIWEEAGIAIVTYPLSHISEGFKEYLKNNVESR